MPPPMHRVARPFLASRRFISNRRVFRTRAPEAPIAFEAAADKIERQLRRYATRLRERKGDNAVIEDAGYRILSIPQEPDETPSENPTIVAETRVDVPEVSVGDAVMMLDLRNTTALLFKNSGTGDHNMVYRRGDGTIGWVEPGGERQPATPG